MSATHHTSCQSTRKCKQVGILLVMNMLHMKLGQNPFRGSAAMSKNNKGTDRCKQWTLKKVKFTAFTGELIMDANSFVNNQQYLYKFIHDYTVVSFLCSCMLQWFCRSLWTVTSHDFYFIKEFIEHLCEHARQCILRTIFFVYRCSKIIQQIVSHASYYNVVVYDKGLSYVIGVPEHFPSRYLSHSHKGLSYAWILCLDISFLVLCHTYMQG
jgi:hypothetical protein